MKTFSSNRTFTPILMIAALSLPSFARGQNSKSAKPQVSPIEAINAQYRLDLEKLERTRLDQLGGLAAKEPKPEAEATYQEYFQLAIAKGLYKDAEPTASSLLKAGELSSNLKTLATLVKIVGEADRGAYDESLKSLSEAIKSKSKGPKPAEIASLTASGQASIVEAYFQRLVRGHQYPTALKAMNLVAENVETPAVRDLAARRAKQLALIGKAAPAIVGVDLDGKPFNLADSKGDVVLVFFWATWCLPVAQEIPWLEATYEAYRAKGFRVVGIDVDSAQDDAIDPKSILSNVRRYLVEFNVPWPPLLNGTGEKDLTQAYSIGEIPANVLIGRDGKVLHLDLTGSRLDQAVADAVTQKP